MRKLFSNRQFCLVLVISLFGLFLRFYSVYPSNIIVGFDQARDLFDSLIIFQDKNLRIIGPTAGNNLNLHHGVFYLYYILPPLVILGQNPLWVVLWNGVFNAATSIVLFYFARSIFKNSISGFAAAFIAAVSWEFVQFSGWLANPSPTLFTVPLFYFGLWSYYIGKNWGLILAALGLGLSIQLELFFIYLIPIAFLAWFLLRPKIPALKLALFSIFTLGVATSTMILTELKFGFAGVKTILGTVGSEVGNGVHSFDLLSLFWQALWPKFANTIWPQDLYVGKIAGVVIISYLMVGAFKCWKDSNGRNGFLFLILYLFSPGIMFLVGFHAAPWFLVGLPPAIALSAGYAISKIKPAVLVLPLLLLIGVRNVSVISEDRGRGQVLLGPDKSALLTSQLAAIDYTYQESAGQPFAINTVTNPLYINAVWAYHYSWYGAKKYGYLPGWLGSDQLYPYDRLPKSESKEEYLYLIVDQTFRIPAIHKIVAIEWADKMSQILEEKTTGEILVQKRRMN